MLITAINAGKDVAVAYCHFGISINHTCALQPFAWSIREVTRTAAKHVAVERVTVITH